MRAILDFFDGLWLMDWIILIAVTLCVAGLIFGGVYVYKSEQARLPVAYEAWCKHTGNPGDLSFEEWQAMVETMTPDSSAQTIIMPMR